MGAGQHLDRLGVRGVAGDLAVVVLIVRTREVVPGLVELEVAVPRLSPAVR